MYRVLLAMVHVLGLYAAEERTEEEMEAYRLKLAQDMHPENEINITPMKTKRESWRLQSDQVIVTQEEIDKFHRDGYVSFPPILRPHELEEIRKIYDKFLDQTIPVVDKDYGDMSMPFDTPKEDYNMINVLLPRTYFPEMVNNIYERRANSIVQALYQRKPLLNLTIDFDQILAKIPNKDGATFAWHQDMGYWPPAPTNVSSATATVSLALNDAHVENGCLVLVSGSHKEGLRPHVPLMAKDAEQIKRVIDNQAEADQNNGVDVADGHALQIALSKDDVITHVPVAAGGVTVHDEWIVHGSPGNNHPSEWRHTYILAFREEQMIEHERKLGFTHSHNDAFQWDSFRKENVQEALKAEL